MKKAAVLLAISLSLPTWAMAEVYGTVMVSKGDIKITSAKTSKTESSKVGFKVYSGDTIVAGADSRAKIIMSDKNVLNISPDSKITIAKYENDGKGSRNVELVVDHGKVRASVNESYDGDKNQFNVKTPTAVAGVRGTDFVTSFSPTTRVTQITTFEGSVAVGSAKTGFSGGNLVYVNKGQTSSVTNNATPSAPISIPPADVKSLETETDAEKAPTPTAANAPAASTTAASGEQKSDSTGSQASAGSPAAETSPAPAAAADRAPAAIGNTGSMISSKDLDISVSKDIKVVDTPKLPTVVTPVVNTTPVPKTNTFIENAVKNQKSRVKVEICLPGTNC